MCLYDDPKNIEDCVQFLKEFSERFSAQPTLHQWAAKDMLGPVMRAIWVPQSNTRDQERHALKVLINSGGYIHAENTNASSDTACAICWVSQEYGFKSEYKYLLLYAYLRTMQHEYRDILRFPKGLRNVFGAPSKLIRINKELDKEFRPSDYWHHSAKNLIPYFRSPELEWLDTIEKFTTCQLAIHAAQVWTDLFNKYTINLVISDSYKKEIPNLGPVEVL